MNNKVRKIIMVLLVLLVLGMLSYIYFFDNGKVNPPNNETISVQSIKLNINSKTIHKGETFELTATISPKNATNKEIVWLSSDESVVSVEKGIVTALNIGTATITIQTIDGNISTSCIVNVIDNNTKIIPVNGVSLNVTNASMYVGDILNLVATISPTNATNKEITWSSSDNTIATVDNGKVIAKKTGNVIISAVSKDGNKLAYCSIKISNKPREIVHVSSVSLNKNNLTLYVGDSETLIATVLPATASNKTVIWTSSNPSVASVSNGKVTGVSKGSTVITVKSLDGEKIATCNVTINEKVVHVTGVTLSNSTLSMNVGDVKELTYSIMPGTATNKTVTWTSSNPSVVSVDNGVVTAKNAGTAIITIKTIDGNKTATCTVTVKNKTVPVTGVTLSNTTLSLYVGESKTINATVLPETATNKEVNWTSSNNKIATVSNGKITTKRTGTVTITATTKDGSKKATCTVTITGARIHFIDLDASADSILLEANGKFAMVDTGFYKTRSIVKKYLDSLDIKDLEFLIISHNHSDHNGAAVYLSTKFNIKKLYVKTYLGHDNKEDEDAEKAQTRYDEMINAYSGKVVYVDKDSKFKETSSSSGYINLDNMKITFLNTNQRLQTKPSNASSKYVGYYNPSYYYGSNENLNSLVNLVEINNHYALLTGDMNLFDAMKDIFKDRINGKISKIDVFKIPHHAIYNCFGVHDYPYQLSYTLNASIGYYVVTRDIDSKYSYEQGTYVINPNKSIWNATSLKTPKNSCMYSIAKGDEAKAKTIMCNAYYANNSSSSAIIFNMSKGTVTVSGGGQGKSVSSRCK